MREHEKREAPKRYGCLLVAGVVVLALTGGAYYLFQTVTGSDAYRGAVTRAARDPRVVDALGEPVTGGMPLSAEIDVDGDEGWAKLEVSLSGPKGAGHLLIDAAKTKGEWTYRELTFRPKGAAEAIDLLVESTATD